MVFMGLVGIPFKTHVGEHKFAEGGNIFYILFLIRTLKVEACCLKSQASRATSQSLPNRQVEVGAGGVGWSGLRAGRGIHSCKPPLFSAPICPPLLPIICPVGRERGPNEPFGTERKEGANCSCDVGVVVPFTAFAMVTGQKLEARSPSLWTASWGQRGSWKFLVTIAALFSWRKITSRYPTSRAWNQTWSECLVILNILLSESCV